VAEGIPVLQPRSVRKQEFLDEIQALNADIFVVAAYGKILPKAVLGMPKYGCINVHGSILPKLRGAAPIQWAIINGEPTTGVTIMRMDEGMDTGDMILKREIPIEDHFDSNILYEKMADLGAMALLTALPMIENGTAQYIKQDDSEATHAPMLEKSMGLIDWNKSTKEILCQIRGMNPWPSAYTYIEEDVMLKIWSGVQLDMDSDAKSGEVIKVCPKEGIAIKTGDGVLLLKEVQAPAAKRMNSADFVKGRR